jgi:hypothetical protein
LITITVGFLGTVLLAQVEPPEDPAARLEIMKRSLLVYTVGPAADRAVAFRLQPEPILRFNNPVGATQDGAIFFWLGEADRPEVAVQVYLRRNDGRWVQDFSSLSTAPLIAEARGTAEPPWTPTKGGVTFQPVPGAPKPAETAEQRLRQMRALAQEFAAQDHFQIQSWQELRLLSRPLARYGKPGTSVLDGALFAFVLGTDPEAYLMIEARTAGGKGPEWHFGFAPMSTYELKGLHKGKQVWTVPLRRQGDRGPNALFHNRFFEPAN